MKKITKNILIFGLILSMLALCACHETPVVPNEPEDSTPDAPNTDVPDGPITLNVEDFVIFEDFDDKVRTEFAYENRTYNAYYDTNGDGMRDTPLTDSAYPLRRGIAIKSKSEYDQIFTDFIDPTPIDYDKEIYILFVFSSISWYDHASFAIINAILINDTLEFDIGLRSHDPEALVACTPFQRFALIRMKKIDFENIVTKKIGGSL